MLVVVSYDVPDDRRRTRLAATIQDFGVRVQYSVFACQLTPEQADGLRARLLREVDLEKDSLRIYLLCADCVERVEIHRRGEVMRDPEVYVL